VLLGTRALPLLWASLLASLAYAAATVLLRVFDAKEWDALRGLVSGRRDPA
jgi:hypothetical protein